MTAITRRLLRRHAPDGVPSQATPSPAGERWQLTAEDGTPVVARVFRGAQVERVLVLYSATACPKALYAAFAGWLAERGWAVVTFDYRGIGESASSAALGHGTGLEQWAADGRAVVAAAAQAHPGLPLAVLGHSIGGVLAATLAHPALGGLLTVGAQHCYWRDWPRRHQPLFALLWMLAFPLAARWRGHVPGRWFGMPENVPGGVARQWSQACRRAHLPQPALAGDPAASAWSGIAQFARPVVAYAIDDDPIGTPRAVRRLHAHFQRSAVQVHVHRPERPLGHFGAFARRGQRLWPELETALRQLSDAAARPHEETR